MYCPLTEISTTRRYIEYIYYENQNKTTMKNYTLRLLLPVLFSLSFFGARAQWVPITADDYAILLNNYTYHCVVDSSYYQSTGYYLDTACIATIHVPRLQLPTNANTDGLRYIKGGVDTLYLDGFVNITYLPPSVRYMRLMNYSITIPVPLPDSLRTLILVDGGTHLLATALPPHLEYINLGMSACDSLPPLPASLTYLNCAWNSFSSLPALPAGLRTLVCDHNPYLTSIPALPGSLVSLSAGSTAITALPALPGGLDTLIIDQNRITSLPSLPAPLRYLNCADNPTLHNLPALSAAMTYLSCDNDSLSVLPALPAPLMRLSCSRNLLPVLPALPSPLLDLNCSNNLLTALPTLPTALTDLNCAGNMIPSISPLPTSLINLNCSGNPMSSLPLLPALKGLAFATCSFHTMPPLSNTIQQLFCGHNPLYSLGSALPDSLTWLECQADSLSTLPPLPVHLVTLDCSANLLAHLPAIPASVVFITCEASPYLLDLPALPDTLGYLNLQNDSMLSCLPPCGFTNGFDLNIQGTNIRCLPNFIPNGYVYSEFLPLPLCSPASGCPFYYNIQGKVHLDTAATCAADSLSPGPLLHGIKVLLKKNGTVLQQMYSMASGDYAFRTDSLTGYDVAVDSSQYPLMPSCPAGGMRSVTLTATDTVTFGQNFGLSCTGDDYKPLGLNGTFRPGQQRVIHISAGSLTGVRYGATCGTAQSGEVTVLLSGPVSYVGPDINALTPSAVAGNMLTYSIADISALNDADLDIIAATDSSADMDSTVCITVIIKSATPDLNVHNDTLTLCNTIRNSFDPNHKEVYPAIASPDGGWLTYTIHFQNTGNDTAYTVVLRDTLSSLVVPETFEYMASSHPAVIQLNGKAMTFTFAKINLVDSATNPPLSEGWIQYRVRSRAGLPLQTQIPNTAYIFFDLNAPIVTNTAVTTISETSTTPENGIHSVANNTTISLYPNPNTGLFTLQSIGAQVGEYTVTDMLGKVIQQRAVTGTLQPVDMREAAPGIYTIAVKGAAPLRFTVVK